MAYPRIDELTGPDISRSGAIDRIKLHFSAEEAAALD
jgi:hypothetical protein